MKNNQWRFLLVIFIVAWAIYEVIPPQSRDLIEEFRTRASNRDATFESIIENARQLQAEQPETPFRNLSEAIGTNSITKYFPNFTTPAERDPTRAILFQIQEDAAGKIKLGLDLQGGMSFLVGVDTANLGDTQEKEQALSQAIEVLRKRVDRFGVAEPVIQAEGENRILIQLPGLSQAEAESARRQITKPAVLEFRLVNPRSSEWISEGIVPPRHEILYTRERGPGGKISRQPLVVKKEAEEGLTGKYLSNASVTRDIAGNPEINLKFNSEGARLFADITRQHVNERLAIVLDNEIYSAPNINEPIPSGQARITGDFDVKEAFELVNVLENPLETPVSILEERSVDPTLGADSIRHGIRACIIGIVAVAVFMLGYYLMAGLVANVALVLNIIILLGVMASIEATLTLPGIAGIVLTIGMAVDANVLIFERIREEVEMKKSLRGSIAAGYDKAFSTIFDANITTLIASVLLIMLGTGPVKGFGTTLTIGIAASMFTALIVTRMILDWLVEKGMLTKLGMLKFIGKTKINFMRFWKPAFALSWIVIGVGVFYAFQRGEGMFDVDFVGGDAITFDFEHPPEIGEVRNTLENAGLGNNIQFQTDLADGSETMKVISEYGKGEQVTEVLQKAFPESGLQRLSTDTVGPQVGQEIQRSAIIASLLALFGILVYVAFRFEFSFAFGAVVAVLHDVLMTLGVFAISGREMGAPMVAAILTIIGFSINDTIVIFDRIREDLQLGVKGSFREIMDMAINQTLSRTIITSGTTFLSTLALFIFGGVVINNFAFTFLVGIVVGTYSSIYIASAIVLWWTKGHRPRTRSSFTLEEKTVVSRA